MTRELTPLELRIENSSAGKTSDDDIVRAICGVIAGEEEKPFDDVDVTLLAEALDAALAFGGESPEEIASKAEQKKRDLIAEARINLRTPDADTKVRRTTRSVRWKVIIPIAAAIAIISSFAAVSIATGRSIADMTNYLWQTIVPGAKIEVGDAVIEKSVGARGYGEFAELLAAEGVEGVLIPVGVEIADPLVVEYGEYREITAALSADGVTAELEIDTPSPYEIAVATSEIAGFDVLVSEYDGTWQGEWIADGAWYMVKTNSETALHSFIAAFAGK